MYDRIVYFVYFNYTQGVLKTFKEVLPSYIQVEKNCLLCKIART